jgi:hypothetical protein
MTNPPGGSTLPAPVALRAGAALRPPGPLLHMVRPGEGEPGEGCGTWATWYCFWHTPPVAGPVQTHCNRRVCPRCFERWAWTAARRAAARLRYGKGLYCIRYGVRHVVVFPPDVPHDVGGWTKKDLDRRYRAVYRTLGRMGFLGGVAICHPGATKDATTGTQVRTGTFSDTGASMRTSGRPAGL